MTLVERTALTTLTATDRFAGTRRRVVGARRPARAAAASRRVSWQRLSSRQIESQAVNTLVSFASVARAYAIDNHIETVLAVDPNGTLRMYRRDVETEGGGWIPGDFQPLGRELDNLPEGLAAAPIDPIDLDADANPGETWVGFCFDSSGRLIQRRASTPTGVAPGWALSPFMTSYGVKVYRPDRLTAHAGEQALKDVDDNDLTAFLNDYTETALWEAVVLNQWNGRPLPMK